MLLSCDILDKAAAAFLGGISIESLDDDGLCAVPPSSHVLLKADAAYTPIFWFLANLATNKVPIMQVVSCHDL